MKKLHEVTNNDTIIDFIYELGIECGKSLSDICHNALCIFIDKEGEKHIVFNNVGKIRDTDELYDAFFKILKNTYNDFYMNKFETATEINILFICKSNKKFINGSKYYMLSTNRQKSKELQNNNIEKLFIDSLIMETKCFSKDITTYVMVNAYDKNYKPFYNDVFCILSNTKIVDQAIDEYITNNPIKDNKYFMKANYIKLIVYSTTDVLDENGKQYCIEDLELPPKNSILDKPTKCRDIPRWTAKE